MRENATGQSWTQGHNKKVTKMFNPICYVSHTYTNFKSLRLASKLQVISKIKKRKKNLKESLGIESICHWRKIIIDKFVSPFLMKINSTIFWLQLLDFPWDNLLRLFDNKNILSVIYLLIKQINVIWTFFIYKN